MASRVHKRLTAGKKSLTAEAAKDAEEKKSVTAKDAKRTIIRTKTQGRQDNAKATSGSSLGITTA